MDAGCNHPPLHDNIDVTYIYTGDNYLPGYYKKNNLVECFKGHLLFINSEKYTPRCLLCQTNFYLYIYGNWPNIKVSFDGVTDLPVRIYNLNVIGYAYDEIVYNVLNFGTFMYFDVYPGNHREIRHDERYIIYSTSGKNELYDKHSYMVDGKLVVHCITKNHEHILVNEDGEIIESRIVHYSDDNINTFKIDNGYLTCTYEGRELVKWDYISPALRTKQALTKIE